MDVIFIFNPRLFHKDGAKVQDGKGGVVYVDPSDLGFSEARRVSAFKEYSNAVTVLVKNQFKNELARNQWFYIYAYDGSGFIPIVHSNMRSSAFTGKNAPYVDVLYDFIFAPPISKFWNIVVPDYNFGRVEFSCGSRVVDVTFQYPDSNYPLQGHQSHFPSLQFLYKRATATYDFALHFATAFKIYLIASLNRSISANEWNDYEVLLWVDKLYCLGINTFLSDHL